MLYENQNSNMREKVNTYSQAHFSSPSHQTDTFPVQALMQYIVAHCNRRKCHYGAHDQRSGYGRPVSTLLPRRMGKQKLMIRANHHNAATLVMVGNFSTDTET